VFIDSMMMIISWHIGCVHVHLPLKYGTGASFQENTQLRPCR
jgi:hypothetical protein